MNQEISDLLSYAQYFEFEDASEQKHEYRDGVLVDMAESTESHNLIKTQHEPRVESILRQPDGTWSLAFYEGIDTVARLRSMNIDLQLSDVFEKVEFIQPSPDLIG